MLGSTLGVLMGSRLSERIRATVLSGLGLLVALIGLQMALGTKNILVVLGAMLLGGLLGEVLRIHDAIERLGELLQDILSKGRHSKFGEGFVTASLIFCVGPMAILGSIQDGLTGDYSILAVKAALDGFAAIAFSATLGWGVAFSAVSIFLYQVCDHPLRQHSLHGSYGPYDRRDDRNGRAHHCGDWFEAAGCQGYPAGQFSSGTGSRAVYRRTASVSALLELRDRLGHLLGLQSIFVIRPVLQGLQVVIQTSSRHERIVGAFFDDAPGVHDHDAVRAPDRR